ncbi:MAG: aminotransferase class V-fold PLP-dependent enzyme [Firmicutes bacterium]|nr:aminotransferase class V-fold PLP-dependent enzyme [Bacillota bacterium]
MAYFDNAATTYPKPDEVYSFMSEFYRNHGGSAGRGDYGLANKAKGIIDETRSLLKDLLHCPAKQVVFTPTATIALNMIIQGVIAGSAKNIYVSPFEHNAVTRILYHFEQLGKIKITDLAVSPLLEYDLERIRYQFDAVHPDMVIVSHASNVIGLIAPVEEIFALAKEYDAITLVDMAQTAGLVDLNVGLETIDYAVFAGHKTLLGPTGISGFLMKPTANLLPVIFGGTGYDSANQNMPDSLPEKYEMGTFNILGVSGLNAALKWIKERTVNQLYKEENDHREKLLQLLYEYPFLSVIGNIQGRKYVGIVSCRIDGISSDSAGSIFAENGIAVRTGLQCAPKAHKFLGTFPEGTIRFSVNCFTSENDFVELRNVLSYIQENL